VQIPLQEDGFGGLHKNSEKLRQRFKTKMFTSSTLPAKHEQAGCVQSRIEVASMSEHISVLQRSSALASQYWPSLFLRQRWHGVNLQNLRLLKKSLASHVPVCINCHLIWFYLLIPAIRKVSPSCFAFNRLKFRYGLFSDKDLLAR
jgi:hypothetical protein